MRLFIAFFLILFTGILYGQSETKTPRIYIDYYKIKPNFPVEIKSQDYSFSGNDEPFFLKPFYFMLWAYKSVASGQLYNECAFVPSCSRFSYRSIHEFGLLKGVLMTADRLTRCNGNAYDDAPRYLIDSKNAKITDNPSFYRFSE